LNQMSAESEPAIATWPGGIDVLSLNSEALNRINLICGREQYPLINQVPKLPEVYSRCQPQYFLIRPKAEGKKKTQYSEGRTYFREMCFQALKVSGMVFGVYLNLQPTKSVQYAKLWIQAHFITVRDDAGNGIPEKAYVNEWSRKLQEEVRKCENIPASGPHRATGLAARGRRLTEMIKSGINVQMTLQEIASRVSENKKKEKEE